MNKNWVIERGMIRFTEEEIRKLKEFDGKNRPETFMLGHLLNNKQRIKKYQTKVHQWSVRMP